MGRGWTELFFLDEAVALAAGHRPCAECRRADYRRWQAAWQSAHGETPTAPAMNARLHADRVPRPAAPSAVTPRASAIFPSPASSSGRTPQRCSCPGRLFPYTPAGYARAIPADPSTVLPVLTRAALSRCCAPDTVRCCTLQRPNRRPSPRRSGKPRTAPPITSSAVAAPWTCKTAPVSRCAITTTPGSTTKPKPSTPPIQEATPIRSSPGTNR